MSSHEAAASKPLYVSQQRIRWGDMDAFGHVNNTLYFRFMEQCRIEWLEEHGMRPLAPSEEED